MRTVPLGEIKTFVKKYRGQLYINIISHLGNEYHDGFVVSQYNNNCTNNFGIAGACFMGNHLDTITKFRTKEYMGYEISNSQANFIIAVKKNAQPFAIRSISKAEFERCFSSYALNRGKK